MADELFGLEPKDVAVLREIASAWRRGMLRGTQLPGITLIPPFQIIIGKADASIAATAAAATTFSSGTVSIYSINSAGSPADTGYNETAYNLSTAAVSTGRWLHMIRHGQSNKLLITFEACT